MGGHCGPNTVTNGLILAIDASDKNSYPGTGTTWSNLVQNTYDFYFGRLPTYTSSFNAACITTNFDKTPPYSQSYLNVQNADPNLLQLLYQDHTIEAYINPKSMSYVYDYNSSLTTEILSSIITWPGYHSGLYQQSASSVYYLVYAITNYTASAQYTLTNMTQYKNKNMHIVGTRSGNTIYLYVNGVLQSSKSNITTSLYPYVNVRIGTAQATPPISTSYSAASNTDFYSIKLYNRYLSAEEVQTNYINMKSRFGI